MAMKLLANSRKSLDLLLRYETTYSRAFDRAQKSLDKMQKSRTESTTTEELRNEPDTGPAIPTAHADPEASAPGNEICETTPSPVHSPPTTHTEPEASAPGNENCETTPSPQTPHQDYEVNGPNSKPQLTE